MLYVLFSTKFSKTCLRLHAHTSLGVLVHKLSAIGGCSLHLRFPRGRHCQHASTYIRFGTVAWTSSNYTRNFKYEQRIVTSFSR